MTQPKPRKRYDEEQTSFRTARSEGRPKEFSSPVWQVDSVYIPGGNIVLAFNDDPQKRTKLTLAASSDGGQTWQRLLVLEDDPDGPSPTQLSNTCQKRSAHSCSLLLNSDLLRQNCL